MFQPVYLIPICVSGNKKDGGLSTSSLAVITGLSLVASLLILVTKSVLNARHKSLLPNQACNSIDCFDTLLFRYHGTPMDFYRFLETKFDIEGFAKVRNKASFKAYKYGKLTNTSHIYQILQDQYDWDDETRDKFMNEEKRFDDMFLYPIKTHLSHVDKYTSVISDTFYTKEEIKQMLIKRDIPFKDLHVSNDGKALTKIWNGRTDTIHLGDNMWSDVIGANLRGVRGVYTSVSRRTCIEKLLHKQGYPWLSNWLRYVRLSGNPYPREHLEFDLWDEQITFNTPLMIWSALAIHKMCQEQGYKRLLFATRDCCHLKKFFDIMFPECRHGYETVTFHCSRKIYENPTPVYIKYVEDSILDDKTLFIDINGTGRSLHAFLNKFMPHKKVEMFFTVFQMGVNYLSKVKVEPKGYLIRRKPSVLGVFTAAHIEKLNYDMTGTLIGWDDKLGPIRAEPECETELVGIHHEATNYALTCLSLQMIEPCLPPERLVETILNKSALHPVLAQYTEHDENFMDMLRRGKKIGKAKYFETSVEQ